MVINIINIFYQCVGVIRQNCPNDTEIVFGLNGIFA